MERPACGSHVRAFGISMPPESFSGGDEVSVECEAHVFEQVKGFGVGCGHLLFAAPHF
jgi:hypothetical protein